jgi:drug/metabolite transporter (DMT)-like permease
MKNRTNYYHLRSGPLLALGSALLFGASTPIAKLLLGITDPLLLAGLLYLGSGVGLALVTAIGRSLGLVRPEAPLRAREVPWLAAIVLFGGILGPALLMSGTSKAQGRNREEPSEGSVEQSRDPTNRNRV